MPDDRKGIKRHKALYPLSHHHHHALVVALKLKKAVTEKNRLSLDELKTIVKEFWEVGGREHFREEEEILLPVFAQYAPIDHPAINEMLLEHIRIRAMVDQVLNSEGDLLKIMYELGELLQTHVRKEERVIFPMIEAAVPEDKLYELEPYLHPNYE